MGDKDSINKLIAEALGIEHVTWQEGYYKELQADNPYAGHNLWITVLDCDEVWGEIFPKDWQYDLDAALTLLVDMTWELHGLAPAMYTLDLWDHGLFVSHEMGHTPAEAVCLTWLAWKNKQNIPAYSD